MNTEEIKKTLDIFKPDGTLIEVRTIGGRPYSGYFKSHENLLKAIKPYANETFYFVFNEIKEGCYSREQIEKLLQKPKAATGDSDIERRRWILVDCDPVRVSGVCATNAEKKLAKKKMNEIYDYLKSKGFSNPVLADSGSGYHLLYKVDMANDNKHRDLVKNFLTALDIMFSDETVKINTVVYNASRITKLYGVMARKGENTKERPHRKSCILRAEDEVLETDTETVKAVADIIPKPEKRTRCYQRFDLKDFLHSHNIHATEKSYNGGRKYILDECFFDSNHKAPDAAIIEMSDGAIGYHCFHNSCQNYKWQDVRLMFEPGAYDREYQPYTRSSKPKSEEPKKKKSDRPALLATTNIDRYSRATLVNIPTGIRELDRTISFNKGELTVWSGVNSSGKSIFLSQLAVEAVHRGFVVVVYSGELTDKKAVNWIYLQSAGKQHNVKCDGEYGVYYETPHSVCDRIDKWLAGKYWLYNNECGMNINNILETVKGYAEKNQTDVVILDNLMSFESGDGDKYEFQKGITKSLSELAKELDVHVHFVCHPRKTTGFLRKHDISGTADITNYADNVLIIHRVNNDFKAAVIEHLKHNKAQAAELSEYDNVIEITKNRDRGVTDGFIGMYYQPEGKLLLNTKDEIKNYGWDDTALKEEEPLPFMID